MKMMFAVLGLGLAFMGYYKYIIHKSTYYPSREIECTPADIGIAYEDIYVDTPDGAKIHGWFIENKADGRVVLYSHGNAGNIGGRLEKIFVLYRMGLSVCIFDYRGFGKSTGWPTEKGLYQDVRAVYDYLIGEKNYSGKDIVLYGESLGSAVAVDLAAQFEVNSVLLEGAFSSGKDMSKVFYPYIPLHFLYNKYNSIAKIKDVKVPKLFMHSKEDELVPYRLAQKLFNAAPEPKTFAAMSGGHNDLVTDSRDEYVSAIESFLKK